MYKKYIKRLLDIVMAAVGLAVLALPMLVIALLVKLDSPGPVLFRQRRLGLHGKEFDMIKFRSMCVDAEHMGSGVYSGKGDERVTKVGRILRATSLDELPQFFNILRGDMSFVGPRPPLTYHPWPIEEYTERQLQMFQVRPGITGWAQVNGRKEVLWPKRIEMNIWYGENMSPWLDLKILFLTVGRVFTNANNNNVGATVEKEEQHK